MTGNLVIVESPAKAKTIERYLGPGLHACSPRTGTSATCPRTPARTSSAWTWTTTSRPSTRSSPTARKQVGEIEKAARTADLVYLATDLDREGEAIAWHVAEAIELVRDKTRRVTFTEITESAIKDAFAHPRAIDLHLVDAQQARRVVDRLVGYTLSPLLWRKVRAGLSAGRVQSVAVRLVVDREREIRAFVAREYWTLEATLLTPERATRSPRTWSGSTAQKPEIGDGDHGDGATPRRSGPAGRSSRRRGQEDEAQPGAAVHDVHAPAGGEPQARLLAEADDVASPSGSTRASRRPRARSASSPTCEPTRSRSPARRWARPRDVIDERFGAEYTMPKGRAVQDQDAQRAGGPRGDPADVVRARSRGAGASASTATKRASTG